MKRAGVVLFLSVVFLLSMPGNVHAADRPEVTDPQPGDALQGVVQIIGFTGISNFQSAEVSFAYGNEGDSWFLINQSSQPVKGDVLASWDTTTIADGIYRLRVQVFLTDGKLVETIVPGLRVRNYTPVETSEVVTGNSQPTDTAVPPATPTTVRPQPTSLPPNPAGITTQAIYTQQVVAVATVFILLGLLGIYQLFKRKR
jgi:hypothetical protein